MGEFERSKKKEKIYNYIVISKLKYIHRFLKIAIGVY